MEVYSLSTQFKYNFFTVDDNLYSKIMNNILCIKCEQYQGSSNQWKIMFCTKLIYDRNKKYTSKIETVNSLYLYNTTWIKYNYIMLYNMSNWYSHEPTNIPTNYSK